jgi:hypothetical protein
MTHPLWNRERAGWIRSTAGGLAASALLVLTGACDDDRQAAPPSEPMGERPATREETLRYLIEVHHTIEGRERFYSDGRYVQSSFVSRVGSYTVEGNRFCVSLKPLREMRHDRCRRLTINGSHNSVVNDGDH